MGTNRQGELNYLVEPGCYSVSESFFRSPKKIKIPASTRRHTPNTVATVLPLKYSRTKDMAAAARTSTANSLLVKILLSIKGTFRIKVGKFYCCDRVPAAGVFLIIFR